MGLRTAIPLAILLLALGLGAVSQAEVEQRGNLRVSFDADFVPNKLPRHRAAPVKVKIEGRIKTLDNTHPPSLRWLEVEINRNGRLSTEGLPTCSAALLQSTSTQTALARCGPAQVGRGSFQASVSLGREIASSGKILAFNGLRGGKQALLLHLFAAVPVRFTLVVPMTIGHREKGEFGTVLRAQIPRIGGITSVTHIGLTIGRRYTVNGERRSYVSAACSAPPGFPGAAFPFARGKFRFEGNPQIRTTLIRDCLVR
ncbi:MAG TPA: hypothetical protein VI039_10345 [Solirubrobacterales bacterium]